MTELLKCSDAITRVYLTLQHLVEKYPDDAEIKISYIYIRIAAERLQREPAGDVIKSLIGCLTEDARFSAEFAKRSLECLNEGNVKGAVFMAEGAAKKSKELKDKIDRLCR